MRVKMFLSEKEVKVMKNAIVSGVKILLGSRRELLYSVRSFLGVGGCVFTPNCLMLQEAKKCTEYRRVLNGAVMNIPDGVGLGLILKSRGYKTEILAGVELGELILENRSFAIIGGREGVASLAAKRLCERHTGAVCKFAISGYGIDKEKTRELLSRTRPDICIVCLGVPKQEYFVTEMVSASAETLYLALGGAVDVYSGRLKRAPSVLRRVGLEWLYRTVCEPHRVLRLPLLFSYFFSEIFTVLNKNKRKSERKISK